MEQLPFPKRLALAAFGLALIAGVLWMAGASATDGLKVAGLLLAVVIVFFAFNALAASLDSLNLSDAQKGAAVIVLPLVGIAFVASCADTRPTYQQAAEIAHESAGMVSYQDVAGTADCSSDCSGHEAGFEWARENGVTESWDCPASGSRSFREGCDAFAGYVEAEIDRLN